MLSRALYPREQEHNVVEAPMTSLFDDFVRADASPSAESEDYFTFLNGVDTPFWAEVRRVLDVWFSRYPGERAPALWEEFRSRRPQQQRAAFWELYLHELFLRLGYQVAVHPGLADTSHTPRRGCPGLPGAGCVLPRVGGRALRLASSLGGARLNDPAQARDRLHGGWRDR
jgi:hypothetical protein